MKERKIGIEIVSKKNSLLVCISFVIFCVLLFVFDFPPLYSNQRAFISQNTKRKQHNLITHVWMNDVLSPLFSFFSTQEQQLKSETLWENTNKQTIKCVCRFFSNWFQTQTRSVRWEECCHFACPLTLSLSLVFSFKRQIYFNQLHNKLSCYCFIELKLTFLDWVVQRHFVLMCNWGCTVVVSEINTWTIVWMIKLSIDLSPFSKSSTEWKQS